MLFVFCILYYIFSNYKAFFLILQIARVDFAYGIQYAYVLVIFSMTIILSVTCPLAAPFGI